MKFFNKKNPTDNLRRRFHHLQLLRRKGGSAQIAIKRQRNSPKFFASPAFGALKKVSSFILIGGVLIGLTYVIIFSSFFDITKVSLEKKGNAISATALSPFLDKLKGKNLVFLRTEPLVKELEQTFNNEILLVRVSKSYPKKLIVKIDEYPAVFNVLVLAPEKEQQFVINQLGYAIQENTQNPDLPKLIYRTAKPFPKKGIIIDREKAAMIVDAFTRLRDTLGMKIPEGEWKKVERELHLKTEKNFYVWIDLTMPVDKQIAKLKRAMAKLDVFNTPLEYIDLRIAGADSERVIYKKR